MKEKGEEEDLHSSIHFCQNSHFHPIDIMFNKVYLNQYLQKTSNDGKTVFIKV